MIIPVLLSTTDIKACVRYLMALQRSGVLETGINIGLVANRVRSNTRYFQTLMELLEKLDLPLLGTLRDTQNYVQAMEKGGSVFEMPKGKVKKDLGTWDGVRG